MHAPEPHLISPFDRVVLLSLAPRPIPSHRPIQSCCCASPLAASHLIPRLGHDAVRRLRLISSFDHVMMLCLAWASAHFMIRSRCDAVPRPEPHPISSVSTSSSSHRALLPRVASLPSRLMIPSARSALHRLTLDVSRHGIAFQLPRIAPTLITFHCLIKLSWGCVFPSSLADSATIRHFPCPSPNDRLRRGF